MSVLALVLHGGYTPPPGSGVFTNRVFRDGTDGSECLPIAEAKEKRIRDAFEFIKDGIDTYGDLEESMNCSTSTVKEATRRLFGIGAIYKEIIGRTHYLRANHEFELTEEVVDGISNASADLSVYESEHEYRKHLITGKKTPQELSILLNNHKTSVYRYLKKLKARKKAQPIGRQDIPGKNGSVLWEWIGE